MNGRIMKKRSLALLGRTLWHLISLTSPTVFTELFDV